MFFQQVRTGDLGGYATSDEFTRAVIANLDVWALFAKLLRRIYAHWSAKLEPFMSSSHIFHTGRFKMQISIYLWQRFLKLLFIYAHVSVLLLNLWDIYNVLCVTSYCDRCSMSWMLLTWSHTCEDIAHMCSQLHLLWIVFLDISDANQSLNMSKNAYVSRIYVGFHGEKTITTTWNVQIFS